MHAMLDAQQTLWLQQTLEKLKIKMQAECTRVGDKIPYTTQDGLYRMDFWEKMPSFWTNGFWAGILWQMYRYTRQPQYRDAARNVGDKLNTLLAHADKLDHDVGFMWLHTAVADYRITGSQPAAVQAMHAANLLAGRFNPEGSFIRAWDMGENRTGWAIIDTMMNLPLLFFASAYTGDPRYRQIAMRHADKTLCHHLRGDGSAYHIVGYDPENGEVQQYPDCQGYSPDSAWSRGQAWALYGFALCFRHTGQQRYLDAAKRTAHFFMANAALTNWLPLTDFRAPAQPQTYDSTAGACAACGLLELAHWVPQYEKSLYFNGAMQLMQHMEQAFCDWDPERDSILQHGTMAYHEKRFSWDVPIIYGDYFFIEALLHLSGDGIFLW